MEIAIDKFPMPIIKGIVHNKNYTLADLMAHTATKTPTQAAEFILHHNRLFERRLLELRQSIVLQSQTFTSVAGRRLTQLNGRILNRTRDFLQWQERLLFQTRSRFNQAATSTTHHQDQLLQQLQLTVSNAAKTILSTENHLVLRQQEKIRTWSRVVLKNAQADLNHLQTSITLMSPAKILQKGFALLKVDGKIITDPGLLKIGQSIEIMTSQMSLEALIKQKKDNKDGAEFNL
jgi:exodeoxyribonuclease VII large subunit